MARLDRLGPAKTIAQTGAAIGREFSHPLLAAVVRKPEAELIASLDRLMQSGLLFRQGLPPHATYLFKHALVQDAAYGTLLREPRRALNARIAETLESQFTDIAENQPELLARHCTEAGQIEKAVDLWGKAGQRSLQRSALVEAGTVQARSHPDSGLTGHACTTPHSNQSSGSTHHPSFPPQRIWCARNQSSHRAIAIVARPSGCAWRNPRRPAAVVSVLFGVFVANFNTFNGDVCRDLATQFLKLAEKQRASYPLVVGHNILGAALLLRGEITEARTHFDQAVALYYPSQHRPLATRFGEDHAVVSFCWRASALWLAGYPETARADIDQAFKNARESGHAVSLIWTLNSASWVEILCGDYGTANARVDELIALTDEKNVAWWRTLGMLNRGRFLGLTGRAEDAAQIISTGLATWRSLGSTWFEPTCLSALASAQMELGQLDEAWRCVDQAITAIETTGEKWFEAEANRTAGKIVLKSPERDEARAEAYFQRALAGARQQQAKSWELRAAMSMARLWRDQGKRDEARELLAPVYGWFTEGFDTRDLKEAKALLADLAA